MKSLKVNKQIESLCSLIDELGAEYGRDYILRAMKIISNRQMLFLNLPEPQSDFLPILKVLEIVIGEIEEAFYNILEENLSEVNGKEIFDELIKRLQRLKI